MKNLMLYYLSNKNTQKGRLHVAIDLGIYVSKNGPDVFYRNVNSRCLKASKNTGEVFLSIVIPTYKRAEFLKEAIDSALNQKDVSINYEVIVVNNDLDLVCLIY